jgi:glycosyltransferase involved in cell wall biosynthesis
MPPASTEKATTEPGDRSFIGTCPPAMDGGSHCLYITRAALRRVGLFDERRFSDTSAAMEDFYVRATTMGFVHLVDDATFIARENADLPVSQMESSRNPGHDIEQPCILALVHRASGGTRFATEDLMLAIANDNRCLLLKTDVSEWLLYEVLNGKLKLSFRFGFAEPWRLDTEPGKDRLAALKDICESFSVDLVNIHHLLCSGPEIMDLFARLNVPVVFSFHDYYCLCPTAHLIDNHGRNCGGTCTTGTSDCPLGKTFFREPLPVLKHRYVHEHRKRMESGLAHCQAYTAPSRASMSVLNRSLSTLKPEDFHIIEHGRDLDRKQLAVEPTQGTPVKLICLGNLNESKGVNLIRELMSLNVDRGLRFEFHFLGGRPGDFRPEDLGGFHHGAYDRGEYFDWLGKISPSFSLCASICEETHSYTLTESWAAGLPVFASGLGALRERIEKHGGGWLFDPSDAVGFFDGMTDVIDTPGAWLEEVGIVNAIPIKTVAAEARAMLKIFRRSYINRDLTPAHK